MDKNSVKELILKVFSNLFCVTSPGDMCSDNGCCMTHKLCNVHVKSMLSCGGCGDSGNVYF